MIKKIVITTFIVSIGAGFFILSKSPAPPPKNEFEKEYFAMGKEKKIWSSRIKEVGPKKAYEEYKDRFDKKDVTFQHVAGHLFGDLLYENNGLDDLNLCDEMLSLGCFHAFLTKKIVEKGLSGVAELKNACLAAFGPRKGICLHGIGHGLIETSGYTIDNLTKALTACEFNNNNSDTQLPYDCAWGVFMGYNIWVEIGQDTAFLKWRKVDSDFPDEPCPLVDAKFQEACYSQLGLWWDKATNGDYKKMGIFCNMTKDEKYKTVCIKGLGSVAATLTYYNVPETIKRCRLMPDIQNELICRKGAASAFKFFPEYRNLASSVCEDLEGKSKQICLETAPVNTDY